MNWVVDDRGTGTTLASSGAAWRCFTDVVMGGASSGSMAAEAVAGRAALTLRGLVRLDNQGGFIQMALELPAPPPSATPWQGIELDVHGDGRRYGLHLRTLAMTAPWQAWRAGFDAPPAWQTLRLPWSAFAPYRTAGVLDPSQIRRIGLVAIGEPGEVALSLGRLVVY